MARQRALFRQDQNLVAVPTEASRKASALRNALDVLDYGFSTDIAPEYLRLAATIDLNRQKPGFNRAICADDAFRQKCVPGLGVKWILGRIRVRNEAKKLQPPHRPRVGVGDALRRQRMRHRYEVAQSVVNRLAFVELNAARDVRVMADDKVGARVYRGSRNLLFIRHDQRRCMNGSLV